MKDRPSLSEVYDDLYFCRAQVSALYALLVQASKDGLELTEENADGLCKLLEHISDEIESIREKVELVDRDYKALKERLKIYERKSEIASPSIIQIQGGKDNECACNRA